MTDLVSVTYEDVGYRYRLTAQATSVTTASFAESKIDKNTQAEANSSYTVTGVEVLNDIFKGVVHLPGGLTETFTLTGGPNNEETIALGGFMFGIGARTLGPYVLSPTDAVAISAWQADNFAHN